MIDELRIWSICRTAEQIAQTYNKVLYGDEKTLLLYVNGEV